MLNYFQINLPKYLTFTSTDNSKWSLLPNRAHFKKTISNIDGYVWQMLLNLTNIESNTVYDKYNKRQRVNYKQSEEIREGSRNTQHGHSPS